MKTLLYSPAPIVEIWLALLYRNVSTAAASCQDRATVDPGCWPASQQDYVLVHGRVVDVVEGWRCPLGRDPSGCRALSLGCHLVAESDVAMEAWRSGHATVTHAGSLCSSSCSSLYPTAGRDCDVCDGGNKPAIFKACNAAAVARGPG